MNTRKKEDQISDEKAEDPKQPSAKGSNPLETFHEQGDKDTTTSRSQFVWAGRLRP